MRREPTPSAWTVLVGSAAASALTAAAIRRVPIYATADAGHSLSDARSLFGAGVRPLGHLPAFPLLTAVTRAMFEDLTTFRVLAVATAAILPLAFYAFVRGRTASRTADIAGALLFAVALPSAEAVGWYGLPMLLGVAAACVALRLIDSALASRNTVRAGLAAAALVVTALTHTVPFAWLLETTAVGVAGIVVVDRWFSTGELRRVVRPALVVAAGVLAGAGATALYLRAYINPLQFGLDAGNLRYVWQFGFRDWSVFWSVAVFGSLATWVLVRNRTPVERRLAVWCGAGTFCALANLIAFSGDPSYETRIVYVLAVPACGAFAMVFAAGERLLAGRSRGNAPIARTWIAVLVVIAVFAPAARAFHNRLDNVVPFYNSQTSAELSAIRFLARQRGAVMVSGSPSYAFAGATTSWLLWGVANRQAFAATEATRVLSVRERAESDDAVRYFSGTHGFTIGDLIVGFSSDDRKATAVGRFADTWFPLARVSTCDRAEQPSGTLTIEPDAAGRIRIGAPSGCDVEFSAVAARTTKVLRNRAGEATLRVRPTLRAAGARHEFDSAAIARERGVRFVWTWTGSATVASIFERGATIVYRNDTVTVFRV